ncbi:MULTISPECIES: type I-C CRISPR-associated protein Cas5c [unclassified Desulfovibrio]|uniref:type I-C CRISPR-associated protein Cas5c n=1 Tax=unclassified Desulfovibrio TaxID=2593640 RepID=UPI000F5D8B47|nr:MULTISPECIES: type I-C CRISPR-associated protein Cas5c [unclassified Desulfovibrio]RRD69408.1 type I-C CRISPR-associated protein Cas5 [Desulfovibrio sp. OH1209_COT-279]RRD86104.1 type I-C CRISPR-associated protein Cas5 [Desulfovibrio sp. OH1186_COT-070]
MYGVRLKIFGDYACFTRQALKGERMSGSIPTPSAVRGILEAIAWKPAIAWQVDAVHVMKPVRFTNIRRNELGGKIPVRSIHDVMKKGGSLATFIESDRQQRASLVLADVEYYVEAHFVLTDRAGPGDSPGKYLDIFTRRLRKGQVYHRPYLGCREFPAFVAPAEHIPASPLADSPEGNRDLGWMLYDLDYRNGYAPMFFRAKLEKGVMRVPAPDSPEVRR